MMGHTSSSGHIRAYRPLEHDDVEGDRSSMSGSTNTTGEGDRAMSFKHDEDASAFITAGCLFVWKLLSGSLDDIRHVFWSVVTRVVVFFGQKWLARRFKS